MGCQEIFAESNEEVKERYELVSVDAGVERTK